MRTTATLALLLGLSGPAAFAETPTYFDRAAAGQIMLSDYMDTAVYGPGDQVVGDIEDVMFDPATGQVSGVVLAVGGFLGMGEKNIAIPFSALKPVSRNGKTWFAISATKEDLKAAPEFKMLVSQKEPAVAPELTQSAKPGAAKDAPAAAADVAAAAPLPGANSFTESQARSRIESMGYTGVSALAKDGQSIWRGSATKDGKSVSVAVDFKGNVVAQ